MRDYSTPEELVKRRIEYLTAFCRNLAKGEIEKYVRRINKK